MVSFYQGRFGACVRVAAQQVAAADVTIEAPVDAGLGFGSFW
jgi:hypothetical protein